jgi:hypothetical protein
MPNLAHFHDFLSRAGFKHFFENPILREYFFPPITHLDPKCRANQKIFAKEHNTIKDNSREKGKENGTDAETNFAIAIREKISDLEKLHRIGEGE